MWWLAAAILLCIRAAKSKETDIISIPSDSVYEKCKEIYKQSSDEYVYIDMFCRKQFCEDSCRNMWLPGANKYQYRDCADIRTLYASCDRYFLKKHKAMNPLTTVAPLYHPKTTIQARTNTNWIEPAIIIIIIILIAALLILFVVGSIHLYRTRKNHVLVIEHDNDSEHYYSEPHGPQEHTAPDLPLDTVYSHS